MMYAMAEQNTVWHIIKEWKRDIDGFVTVLCGYSTELRKGFQPFSIYASSGDVVKNVCPVCKVSFGNSLDQP